MVALSLALPARAASRTPAPHGEAPLQLICVMAAAKGAIAPVQACALMRERLAEGLGRPVALVGALPRRRPGDWISLRLDRQRPDSLAAHMQASFGGVITRLPEIGVDVQDRSLRASDLDRLARAVASAAQGLATRRSPR